jgi:CHAD domain-containing protein
VEPLIKALVKVQDHLGALQDAVVGIELVTSLLHEHPENVGLMQYADTLAAQRDQQQTTFVALWGDLSDPGFSQELAELIAGL